jgi:hypothetical protein
MTYPLLFATLYLAGGLIIFLMGLVILRESPRSPVNRATAFMLFSGALGTVLGALGRLVPEPAASGTGVSYAAFLRNFSYLWEFFFPSLLYFALVYPRRWIDDRNLHVVEAGLYVPYLTHLALVLFFGETTDVSKSFDPLLQRLGPGVVSDVVATLVEVLDVLVTIVNRVHLQLFSLVNFAYAALAIYLLARSRHAVRSSWGSRFAFCVTGRRSFCPCSSRIARAVRWKRRSPAWRCSWLPAPSVGRSYATSSSMFATWRAVRCSTAPPRCCSPSSIWW